MAYIVQVPMWMPYQPGALPSQPPPPQLANTMPYSNPQMAVPPAVPQQSQPHPQPMPAAPRQAPPPQPSILSPLAESSSNLPLQLTASRLPYPRYETLRADVDRGADSKALHSAPQHQQQQSPQQAQPGPQAPTLPLPQHLLQQPVPLPPNVNTPGMMPMNPSMQPMEPLHHHPHGAPPYPLVDPRQQHAQRGSIMIPMNGVPMVMDQFQMGRMPMDGQFPPQMFYAPYPPPPFGMEGVPEQLAARSSISSNTSSAPELDSSSSSTSSNESSSPVNSPDLSSTNKAYVSLPASGPIAPPPPIRLAPLRHGSQGQPLPQLAESQIDPLRHPSGSKGIEPPPRFTKVATRPTGSGRIGKQPVRDPIKLKHRVWLQQNRIYQDKLHTAGFRVLEGTNGTKRCSLCNKHFAKEMFVWRHALSHVDEKPFHCTVCDQKFTRSDTLQRHVRRAGHLGATV